MDKFKTRVQRNSLSRKIGMKRLKIRTMNPNITIVPVYTSSEVGPTYDQKLAANNYISCSVFNGSIYL